MLPPDSATEHAPTAGALPGSPVDVLVREDIKVTRAPIVATILQDLGFDARVAREHEVELAPGRILLVGGNPRWFKRVLSRVASLSPEQRPYVVVWHTEGLPMPAAAGFPPERLTLREAAKIVLRDRRINDQYSSARYLRRLSREGIVTVLAVSARRTRPTSPSRGSSRSSFPSGIIRRTDASSVWSGTSPSSSSASTASGGGGES